jgi:hypothetical protein
MRTLNDGQRPSHLELDRYATGEVQVEPRLDDASRRYLEALAETKRTMPALDIAAVRARAKALDTPPAANNTRYYWVVAPVLLAVAALLFALGLQGEDPGVRFRTSGDGFALFQRSGEHLVAYEAGTPLGQGDVVGFKVVADGHREVVVLSVDGTGTVTVFYPEPGDRPEPLVGDGFVPLPFTVKLDGAPGPEVFLAVFDKGVSEARSEVERTFQAGGHTGLQEWARTAPDVGAVEITRR